ncbi:circadian clock-controlled protein daywake-like [Pieris napi]|uniref:circadian clock-controlled protein daywake-like n=1 Tax=Pieris napi TaxID=78633 RepID=UPI001FB976F3|nr:circadian clock-controlled protein daywake-like [Pieris napi]
MGAIFCALFLAMQLAFIQSAIPRVYIKCSVWDSGCLTRQAQIKVPALTSGIPELFTETLDPMLVNFARVDLAGLKMDLNNAVIQGFRNAVIDRINIDTVSRQIQLVYHTDLAMKSRYSAQGSILNLPFNGDGEAVISAKKVQMEYLMPFEISKDAFGRDVIDLKGLQYWFDVKDNVRFDYTNLFYGNKGQSDLMHQFLNTNWKSVALTYGRPVFDVLNMKIFNAIRSYLLSQPIEEIFLN